MLTTKCSARAHSLMLCQGEVMRKTRDKAVWSNSMYYKFMIQAWVWDIAWLQIYGLTNQGNLSNIIGLQIILMDKFKWEYQNPSFHQFIAGGKIVETWLHQRKTRVFGRKTTFNRWLNYSMLAFFRFETSGLQAQLVQTFYCRIQVISRCFQSLFKQLQLFQITIVSLVAHIV